MEMRWITKTNQTQIKVSLKNLPKYQDVIDSYIAVYGGREEK